MSDWLAEDIHANGIKIHYNRTGGSKPPIVLCHGATDNGLCWTPVASALEVNYDVIMPDFPLARFLGWTFRREYTRLSGGRPFRLRTGFEP